MRHLSAKKTTNFSGFMFVQELFSSPMIDNYKKVIDFFLYYSIHSPSTQLETPLFVA